jgi:sugar phosphate permease
VNLAAKQRQVFLVTWITYAGFYFCRKNLSVVLPMLSGNSGLNRLELANIVFGYTLLYVVGQFCCGFLSDRVGARRVVGAGLLLVVGCNLLMGAHVSFLWLLVLGCLNGLGQSTGWSGLVKTMAMWFNRANRGVVMAWWGTNYVLGGFVATAFATWAVTQHQFLSQLGWRRGFILPALVLLGITAIFLSSIRDKVPEGAIPSDRTIDLQNSPDERRRRSDAVELLRKPSLWMVSISYFFLELCRYALMFWLPLYMVDHLRYTLRLSGYMSSLYELVGIAGALIAGYVSDRLLQSRRAPVSAVMLFGLGFILLCQPVFSRYGPPGIAVLISLAGVFSYGPDTLLSGAWAQDIGASRTATATGLVEGIGHVGALFSPYVVVYVSGHSGWDSLFLVFAGAAFLAGIVLVPIWNRKPESTSQLQFETDVVSSAG